MQKIKDFLFKTGIFYMAVLSTPVLAAPAELKKGSDAAMPTDATGDLAGSFRVIANILIFLVGAVAVLVIIMGGFTYVISSGDPARIKRAKDTILYGVVGVVVAILAFAIVTFVVTKL